MPLITLKVMKNKSESNQIPLRSFGTRVELGIALGKGESKYWCNR